MEIKIKKENNKHLVQLIYLGNLIINEYGEETEEKLKYADFVNSVLLQIVEKSPKPQNKYTYTNMPNEKTQDVLLADLRDRLQDSVEPFYTKFQLHLYYDAFAEFCVERLMV